MPRVFLLTDGRPVPGWFADLPRDRFLTATGTLAGPPRRWLREAAAAVAFAPDVLHAVGPRAACSAYLLKRLPRIGLPAHTRVLVADAPPEVSPAPPPPDPSAFRERHGIPVAARLIVAAGTGSGTTGLVTAALGFDVLRYAEPDVYLLVVGDGPDRDRAERFGRGVGFDDYRILFAPPGADRREAIGAADIVWVTAGPECVAVALEGMAAGKPVVAAGPDELRTVLDDGATGRLVPTGDRVALAATTRDLLADPATAARLGAAGRARSADFPPGGVVRAFAAFYDAFSPRPLL